MRWWQSAVTRHGGGVCSGAELCGWGKRAQSWSEAATCRIGVKGSVCWASLRVKCVRSAPGRAAQARSERLWAWVRCATSVERGCGGLQPPQGVGGRRAPPQPAEQDLGSDARCEEKAGTEPAGSGTAPGRRKGPIDGLEEERGEERATRA